MNIEELKAYMKSKGVSQIELSQKTGIPLQTLRKIFSGNVVAPRIDTMQAIYKALGLYEGGEEILVPKELLEDFQSLSEENKQRVIGYIKALTEAKRKG